MLSNIYIKQKEGSGICEALNAIIDNSEGSPNLQVLCYIDTQSDQIEYVDQLKKHINKVILDGKTYRFSEFVSRSYGIIIKLDGANVWTKVKSTHLDIECDDPDFIRGVKLIKGYSKKGCYISVRYTGESKQEIIEQVEKSTSEELLVILGMLVGKKLAVITTKPKPPPSVPLYQNNFNEYRLGLLYIIKQAGTIPTEVMVSNMLTEIGHRRNKMAEMANTIASLTADLAQSKEVIAALLKKDQPDQVEIPDQTESSNE